MKYLDLGYQKVQTGDKFILNGACQYAYTRDKVKVVIDPYDTIIKIKDTFSDKLSGRCMYRIISSGWEVNIHESFLYRYFAKLDEDSCSGCKHLFYHSDGSADCKENWLHRCNPYLRMKYEKKDK